MPNYRSHKAGGCPYCLNPSLNVCQCTACDKYFANLKINGTHYPLQDPADPSSSPAVTSRD